MTANGTNGSPETDLQPRRRARYSAGLPLPAAVDRLPPCSIECEQGLLGCIILDPKFVFNEIGDTDLTGYFYDLRHEVIFECFQLLHRNNKPIDLLTVADVLKSNNQLEPCGGITYLSALGDAVPSPANAGYYVTILAEKFALRQIIATGASITSEAYETEKGDPFALIDKAAKTITELGIRFSGQKTVKIKDLVFRCLEKYEKQTSGEKWEEGLTTGFPDYDRLTGGLKPGEYVIIAARPSLGKTSWAMNVVDHVSLNLQKPVGVFSLEMTSESLVDRMICARARVNSHSIRDRTLQENDFPKLTNSASRLMNAPIYIDDTSGLNILQLRARAKKWKQDHDIKLLVIDYMQLVSSVTEGKFTWQRNQEIAAISKGIKDLLKELSIPGIVLSQLNRDIEKEKKARKPRLSDLRESGSLEQDGDTIGFLYRPTDDDEEEDEDGVAIRVKLTIRKQRNGKTGEIDLVFFKEYTRYESAARIDSKLPYAD